MSSDDEKFEASVNSLIIQVIAEVEAAMAALGERREVDGD